MKHIESLTVKYHQEKVGTLSLSADGKVCTFEYDNQWLASGFSISPLELPLKPGLSLPKPPLSTGTLASSKTAFQMDMVDTYCIKPC